MAGVDDEYLLANEVGCIFGNDSSSTPVIEAAAIMNEKHDSQLLGSGYIFQAMNSTVTMNLSTISILEASISPLAQRVQAVATRWVWAI